MNRQRKHQPKLPLSVMNALRGRRSSLGVVSQARATIKVDLFPTLVDKLPLFPYRGHPLLPPVGGSVARFRTDLPLLDPIPLEKELSWAAAIFAKYSQQLTGFLALKHQLEQDLLLGRFESCETLLARIEAELGFSFWLLEVKFAMLQASQGLEGQKAYSKQIRSARREGDLVSFLAHFISWRNEDTTNPFQFQKTLADDSDEWSVPQGLRNYLLFRLTDHCTLEEGPVSDILRHEASYSLTDYYESFIQLSTKALSKDEAKFRPELAGVLPLLAEAVPDTRLLKLASAVCEDAPRYLSHCATRPLSSDEALLVGDSGSLRHAIETELPEHADAIHIWRNGAVAELESGCSILPATGLGSRFARLLRAAMGKNTDLTESVLEGARLILNHRYLSSASQFRAFLWPELSSAPEASTEDQLSAFFSSRYIEPSTLRFLPPKRRPDYEHLLDAAYGHNPAVDFAKWRAGSGFSRAVEEQLQRTLDPSVFNEVAIEHEAAAGNYERALELARQLKRDASPRIRRIAERWIADCLLRLDRVDEAIDYVCRACLLDPGLIPMMPVRHCALALDKGRRAALAGQLSAPIVLDIYDRECDSDLESERNYAYEDFLTAHGIQKPSQLKNMIQLFERPLLIYYLRFLCIPEVMQVSTAFTSSREVDEERLAVCAILAELDQDNIEEHETEIRNLTRKTAVRRGVRAVEQSKIFVDMPAIKRWADKALKEAFTRYQALLSAGLDAGGAGIDSALRDLLAGTPVSEEYLRLPKTETGELLVNMLRDFLTQCLTNPAHGLDCYLSMRVRHGALAGQVRAPLEKEAVICQREGLHDDYKPNDYWRGQLEYMGDHAAAIDQRLRGFSKDFDAFVDDFASNYIQVHSAEKTRGLFDMKLNALVVRALASHITTKATFESFVSLCSDLFWQLLDHCLEDVRSTIEEKFKPEMTRLFESLRADLRKIQEPYTAAELDAAIVTAQTRVQQALEQVKDWFRLAKPLTQRDFSFEEIVEIGLECVKALHPDFRPRVSLDFADRPSWVAQLDRFSDIFFIIFDNVRKHSGLPDPQVAVSARLTKERLEIEVTNELSPDAITDEKELHVSQIRETIAQGEGSYLRAARSEGGTGLKKLSNILKRDTNSPRKLLFGFERDRFVVRFDLSVVELARRPEEQSPHD